MTAVIYVQQLATTESASFSKNSLFSNMLEILMGDVKRCLHTEIPTSLH
jgi:hypothetical protein